MMVLTAMLSDEMMIDPPPAGRAHTGEKRKGERRRKFRRVPNSEIGPGTVIDPLCSVIGTSNSLVDSAPSTMCRSMCIIYHFMCSHLIAHAIVTAKMTHLGELL